jgi:hypothetical protein
MIRKMVIALAAVAAVTAGLSFGAAAMHGGGIGHGGFGGAGFGHAAFGHPGGFGASMGARSFGLRGDRFAFRDRFDFRRPFIRNRFAFIGGPFPYGDDDCYSRVWTRWGWRWTSACY